MTSPAAAARALPRARVGPQPQHLLLTLLGDYWRGPRPPIPSRALIGLLADFGVTETSARAAIGRLARRDLLELTKDGRRTCYRLTAHAHAVLATGLHRVLEFGDRARDWDGRWTIVLFSVPENRRDLRHSLRSRLRWLGFAPLYDGSWVCPGTLHAEAAAMLRSLGITSATVLTATEEAPSGALLSAWDLDSVAAAYRGFLARFGPLAEQVAAGTLGPAQALHARTALVGEWRGFPGMDPDLPGQLLPPGWPRAAARRLFTELYDGLGPLAEARFRQLIDGPPAALLVTLAAGI